MSQPHGIFETPLPRVYTLSPAADFLKSLARTLVSEFPDPEALAGVTVLLPTRRAGRALAEAFTAVQAERKISAAILPLIRPLGDVDADEPPFEPGELEHLAAPAISAARRRFELASLILAREDAARREMTPDGALVLADALASLLDELASEEITGLGALESPDVRASLPADRQEAALFLDIVLEQWPAHLEALGLTDPAARRSVLLNALASRWQESPPPGPVIAAGSTGSIPASAHLLSVIARLEKGAVVLPGFAGFMDEASWKAIDEGHPQRAMKALIERIGIDRQQVRDWPLPKEKRPGREAGARTRLVTEALRPADETADWLARIGFLNGEWEGDIVAEGLTGLTILEARDPASEARAIALALRETLETPGRTAMVVTPDRALARRITTEMSRFGVELDDSAGEALSDTAPGAFLMRVVECAADPGSALALAALWASPLLALGEARPALMADIATMERETLRGRRPGKSFADVIARVGEGGNQRWTEIVTRIEAALTPLLTLQGDQPAASFALALVEAAEALSASDKLSGADRLWAGEAGMSAAGLMREFLEEAEALPPLSLRAFSRVLLETARGRRVRPRSGTHPRLALLGPLEARLLHADRVILAGLNEGVWPQKLGSDPFLSRAMRKAAGLPAPERRLGLAAHDFAELASLSDVILTRSTSADGAPTVASRWLWRLQTLTRGALGKEAAEAALTPARDYLALGAALDTPARLTQISEPLPRPPVAVRPNALSVTAIETWVRDPYAINARHILKLDVLDPLDREPGPAERGTAWHSALELWVKWLGDRRTLPDDALERLLALGEPELVKAGFTSAEMAVELARFAHAARWMVENEAERRAGGNLPVAAALETRGAISFDAGGQSFTLSAKPDRIDRGPQGYAVLDYKTGNIPSETAVLAGFSPQLTLTGAILAGGGFAGVPAGPIHRYRYIAVKGTKTAGEEKEIPGFDNKKKALKADPEEMHAKALERLVRYAAKFADPQHPYHSQPRRQFVNDYGDYDHLARRSEWSTAPDKEDWNGEDGA
ncbi:MAG: double-strand break repair protein AddB [Oceanicaulis sp.]|uniref:double-strand break repair protein AddB n=1 Tax=Glycocaulis sp. TaxID=1969725 RepID=UPI0025C306EB|nr:double-strand break repair protein AddB [Glycocaulis sp.]MCC5981266.1 double-strand break repair protein AddB [Oceanicaulis sp.]MCH8520790.1 double-strand break repair protein AddB [Glycocaulis sp.]